VNAARVKLAGINLALVKLAGPVSHVLDFCYPGRCAACNEGVDGAAMLCPACDDELHKLELAAGCTWCGRPIAEVGAPCPYCLGEGIAHYDRVLRLATFTDPLKHLIHQMKYHRRWGLAEELAGRLLAQERVKEMLSETEVIVPVPLHRIRQVSRGYARVGRPVVRLRHTESQITMTSAQAREENLRNAFGLVNPKCVSGKHVVVVDDVMTTGATLRAVARALRPAKPASLSALVIAVADPKGQDFQSI
jgi:ComF family protein